MVGHSGNGNGNGNGNGSAGYAPAAGSSEMGAVAFHGYGGRTPRVLAYGGLGARVVAHDERHIYWTDSDDGTVTRLPKDGGVPLILATGQAGAGAMTLVDGWLYWVNYRYEGRGSVVRMPSEGGEIEVIADGQEMPEAVAVHGDTVVWTTFGDGRGTGTVAMKTLGGGTAVTLASKQKQPRSIAIDAHQVYWANYGLKRPTYFRDGSVMRMPRGAGKKRFILAKDQPMASSLVMDDEWIYWATATSDEAPILPSTLWKRRKEGGRAIQLATRRGGEDGLVALDATHVYWLQRYGAALVRVPKGGGEPEQLMAAKDDVRLMPRSFAVDDRCVYWTVRDSRTAGGAVFKMAK
jgi:hypothetical protein